jgi:hypothetical protein
MHLVGYLYEDYIKVHQNVSRANYLFFREISIHIFYKDISWTNLFRH